MPHRSTFADLEIPETDLWTFIFERADRPFPDHHGETIQRSKPSRETSSNEEILVLFVDADTTRSYTFSEAKALSTQLGKSLCSVWGFRRGDVVLFYTPNAIDMPVVMLGVLWAGCTVSPANSMFTAEELARQLKHSKASAIVTQKPYLATVREAVRKAGVREGRILLLGDAKDESGEAPHWTDMTDTSFSGVGKPAVDAKDLSFIVYSSVSGHNSDQDESR